MKKDKLFGAGFAKAFTSGAAGAAAFAAGIGLAGQAKQAENSSTVTTSGGGGSATVTVTGARSGTVGNVSIMGGKVRIDGTDIPEDVSEYTSPSGRKYRIHRDGGKVNVTSE